MIKKQVLILLFFISTLIYAQKEKMKISVEKPILDNFIVINITGDGEKKTLPKEFRYHRVVKGETLGGIAMVYDKTTKRLVEINQLKNPDLIFPKQKIYLENKQELDITQVPEYHIVKPGENIIEIAYYYELDFREIIRINKLRTYVLQPNQKLKLKEVETKVAN